MLVNQDNCFVLGSPTPGNIITDSHHENRKDAKYNPDLPPTALACYGWFSRGGKGGGIGRRAPGKDISNQIVYLVFGKSAAIGLAPGWHRRSLDSTLNSSPDCKIRPD